MKKQLIIALAFSISAFSFAQKKELKTAEKAIKGIKYAEAKTALKQAESLISVMDDKSKAKFYYLYGQALYAGGAGSIEDVSSALGKLDKVQGLYKSEIEALKQTISNGMLTKGNDAYEKKDFSSASKYFEKSYRVTKKDTLILYYAAATAVNVKEYDRALVLYEELKQLGYTGITKEYYATDKETDEEVVLDKTTRDLYVKAKTHINPGERTTKSKKPEIVKNVALIYVSEGDNEKAIAAIKDARAESPDDANLVLTAANLHFKMGNIEEFKKLLEEATALEPNNPELQYNLGVVAADSKDFETAKKYYAKAIELDPNYANAYINSAALILDSAKDISDQMSKLGTSKADDIKYDKLKDQYQEVYKSAIPYLTKVLEIDSKNVSAARTLRDIYSLTGDTVKYKEMKAKVETLEVDN